MHTTITVKLEANSRQELINTFASEAAAARVHFDSLRDEGVFGDPKEIELRYLYIGSGWRNEREVVESLAALRVPAEPEAPELEAE